MDGRKSIVGNCPWASGECGQEAQEQLLARSLGESLFRRVAGAKRQGLVLEAMLFISYCFRCLVGPCKD